MPTKSVDLPHLRNVVLAGHAAAGKTTLAEQLLFRTGAVPRLGKVDDGTASLDFEPEEQKRHESLSLAVASLDDEGTRVTLLDTPGYADFVAEVIQGFAAADGALLVMDASGGVESGLEKAVALGRSTGRAACFFINKCDRENADPNAALDALRSSFGTKIAPLHLAIGVAESFSGYVDLVHRKAFRWDGKQETEIPIPDELAGEVDRRRDQLLEAAAEADDDVLTKYLEGEDISALSPHKRAAMGIGWVAQEREIFPSLNVEENLCVAARPGRWGAGRTAIRRRPPLPASPKPGGARSPPSGCLRSQLPSACARRPETVAGPARSRAQAVRPQPLPSTTEGTCRNLRISSPDCVSLA